MITHLEPDILEREIKWALRSITMNKASGSDGIPASNVSLTIQNQRNLALSSCCGCLITSEKLQENERWVSTHNFSDFNFSDFTCWNDSQIIRKDHDQAGNKTKRSQSLFYFLKFIYLFLPVLGLHCCVSFSLVKASRGFSLGWFLLLWTTGSRAHRLQ